MGRISMPQGKGSQLHNRRDYKKIGREVPDNIDATKSNENIFVVDKDLRAAYDEIFGDALAAYNSKQKRADRKIESYYDHIKASKNGEKLFYEDVVQWGGKDDFADPETRQKARDALLGYVRTFEERNPNLRLVGAYIHMDEASPHLHLDYIPVAHGYTRGLEIRNSLDRAMKEMGFAPEKENRKNNATKLWKENERAYFADLCRGVGLEVEEERKSRGSLSVEEYKEARDQMMGEIEQEYAEKSEQIEKLDEIAAYIASDAREMVKAEDMTIPEKRTLLGRVEAPERVGTFVEGMDKGQVEALIQRVETDDRIAATLDLAQEQSRQIIEAAHKEAAAIKAEATAARNETVAKAEEIVKNEKGIMAKARAWAEDVRKKCEPVLEKYNKLTERVQQLKDEVKALLAQKEQLEPLRAEVEELTRVKAVLTGAVENEITQSKFYVPVTYRDEKEQWDRLDRGELIALYKDGKQRVVTRSERGGLDYQTLRDRDAKLCRIGWFKEEERVTIPRNLLRELMRVRDKEMPISMNLERMISQQTAVNKAINKVKEEQERE